MQHKFGTKIKKTVETRKKSYCSSINDNSIAVASDPISNSPHPIRIKASPIGI
jgi:hypothetical protein